jgi:hypothetical protein
MTMPAVPFSQCLFGYCCKMFKTLACMSVVMLFVNVWASEIAQNVKSQGVGVECHASLCRKNKNNFVVSQLNGYLV